LSNLIIIIPCFTIHIHCVIKSHLLLGSKLPGYKMESFGLFLLGMSSRKIVTKEYSI
jgi:hypothetical protein